MIRTILIEDELQSRDFIKQLVKDKAPFIEIIAETGSVDGAIKLINEKRPQLALVDIQLQGRSAFDIFKEIKDIDFQLVFITTFEHFAIPAIKLSAVDYILKPISPAEFKTAMDKVARRAEGTLDKAGEGATPRKNISGSDKLIISDFKDIHVVQYKNIIYLEADGSYTHVILDSGKKILSSKSISEYEETLTGVGFYRVHKSYIINMQHVVKYVKGRGGQVVMANGDVVYVSIRKKEDFLASLGN